jgi:hypothetical protein
MSQKLTYNEKIGLLLTGILIVVACIATAVIPQLNTDTPPSSSINSPASIATNDSLSHTPPPQKKASIKSITPERTHLNEEF